MEVVGTHGIEKACHETDEEKGRSSVDLNEHPPEKQSLCEYRGCAFLGRRSGTGVTKPSQVC